MLSTTLLTFILPLLNILIIMMLSITSQPIFNLSVPKLISVAITLLFIAGLQLYFILLTFLMQLYLCCIGGIPGISSLPSHHSHSRPFTSFPHLLKICPMKQCEAAGAVSAFASLEGNAKRKD
jgi:hypothetical protein